MPNMPAGSVWRELGLNIESAARRLHAQAQTAQEEKDQVAAILESMAEGVAVIDTNQRVLLVNSVLGRAFGLDKDETAGRYYWEVFRDLKINEMIEKALSGRIALRKEHAMMLSGAVYQIQISPVLSEGGIHGVVAVFYDVSKLKELERTRSEFIANVSHELKTPLTSILGYVETLKEGGIEDARNRGRFLEIIEKQAAKLHELIEDLMLLSKVESGRQELKKEALDLEKLLNSVLSSFERAIAAKKIRVQVDVHPRPFFIQADLETMDQAFSNLTDNAVKYNEPDGEILFTAWQEPECMKIRVRNSGRGIPPDDLPRIFERFYRVDKSRSKESGGSGLGLSIVKHIIERHAGRIEVESPGQRGASFTITLPKS